MSDIVERLRDWADTMRGPPSPGFRTLNEAADEIDRLLSRPEPSDVEAMREALEEAVEASIARNNQRHAYDYCLMCKATWWGPREGRANPEPERHNLTCPVRRWRRALGQREEG